MPRKYSPWFLCFATAFSVSQSQTLSTDLRSRFGGAGTFDQRNTLFHIQNFSFQDYGAHPENFAIAQDHRGFMYFANGEGLLEFDGVSWRLLKPLKSVSVTAVATDATGNLFVGGMNEFGYYPPDKRSDAEFITLHERLPIENRRFYRIRQILVTSHGVYFKTPQTRLFRIAGDSIREWRTKEVMYRCFVVRDELYVHQLNVGLTKLLGDSLVVVSGGERFAQRHIEEIVPYRNSAMLIAVRGEGLFHYKDGEIARFPTAADDFLRAARYIHNVRLSSGHYAFGRNSTSEHGGGVCIIDHEGRLLYTITRQSGLRDENINAMFVDREKGLWLALNDGLARIEIPAPFRLYNKQSGLKGSINAICRHGDRLYVGTSAGLFYQTLSQDYAAAIFAPVKDSPFLCHDLLGAADDLLAATLWGLHRIAGTSAIPLRNPYNWPRVTILHASLKEKNRIYLGATTGLDLAMKVGNDWQRTGLLVGGVADNVLTIAQEDDGTLWLGTRGNGVFRIDGRELYPKPRPEGVNANQFGEPHGLDPAHEIKVFRIDKRIHIATQNGVRRFDAIRQRFVPDSTFGEIFADSTFRAGTIHQDRRGRLWIIGGKARAEIHLGMPQANGTYTWQKYPFHRLRDVYFDTRIYSDIDGAVWFGLGENLVRYDPVLSKGCSNDYGTIIRQVTAGPEEDVIFDDAIAQQSIIPELSFKNNSLRFRYTAPSFEDLPAMRYQTKLDGYNPKWSNWTDESQKEYANLPEGAYRFRVRARNSCGEVSPEGVYAFRILSPWHRRWWAYAIYVLLVGAGIFGIVKSRVRRLEGKTQQLEAIVAERTATVHRQAEKLQEMDRLKSRFFANISHEFRTPLTLILGPLEDMIVKVKDQAAKEDLRVMERNANRLLRLINQLLDLSRLESGRMTLHAGHGDFIGFLRGVVMSFASLAAQKKIALHFESAPGLHGLLAGECYFDRDKIEKIFYNLLSNAFKFTPEEGTISVTVAAAGDSEPRAEGLEQRAKAPALRPRPSALSNFIAITVRDNGIGIPAGRLPHIFDRFYQIDSSHTREHEGTGIGLALTKELVERHYGKIEVRSAEGEGTEFIVYLPLGKEHLKPEEIVAEMASGQFSMISDQLAVAGDQLSVGSDKSSGISNEQHASIDDHDLILVVDDHPDMRRYIREHLEPSCRVMEAKDGKEGLDIALEGIPDLVISDVMMPQLDGYQLCTALKTNEKTSHIPVILLTAKAGEESKLTGLETGADDYLVKPFSSRELQLRAQNLIEQRRRLRERFRREGLLQPRGTIMPSVEEAFLQKMMNVLEQHLADEDFGVERLSEKLHIGRRQLHRKIRGVTGLAPVEFIRSIRLQRAKGMLEQHAGTVSEIAFQTGFNNLSHFAKWFRQEFGSLPSELLKKPTEESSSG